MINDERHVNYKSNMDLLYNSFQKNHGYKSHILTSVLNNDFTFGFKLSESLKQRNGSFLQEKDTLILTFCTEVEYKNSLKFDKYKIEVKENRLLILGYVSSDNNINKNALKQQYHLINSSINTSTASASTSIKRANYNNPILVLDFNYITASMTLLKEKMEIKIYVLGTNRVFRIRVNNKEIYTKLSYAISISISTSRGKRMNMMGVSLRRNWHKNYFISHDQFARKAKTGDMLLFRGLECPSTCQRCFTFDEYDHVVFLQKKQNTLFLFEATSNEGCKLKQWIEFTGMLWNLVYEKVVYRELLINSLLKDQIQQTLDLRAEEFINETKVKKYDISVCSIICGGKKRRHEEMNQWSQSKGFSCSSLLSAAYLYMGLIPYIKEAGTAIPGQFSNKAQMKFNQPFELGPEIIIDFSG